MKGRMDLGVGCVAWLILPCHATHGAEWNGQPWQNYPAGQYEKEGQPECHIGHYKFYCDICKKGFSDVTHYNEHKRNHEGLKYHCDYCAKPFLTKKHISITYQCLLAITDLHVMSVVKATMINLILINMPNTIVNFGECKR